MARIMRTAIGRARRRRAAKVENIDVEWATTEIRNEYRRILDKADIEILRKIHQQNRLEYDDRCGLFYSYWQFWNTEMARIGVISIPS